MTNQTLAVIIGNRDFFPDRLVSEGRREILIRAGRDGRGPPSSWARPTPNWARSRRGKTPNAAPSSSRRTATGSTASSSCCPISATSAGSPTRSSSPDWACRSWCRPIRRSRPALCRAPSRCVLRQDFGLQQPAPVRLPFHADRRAHGFPVTRKLQGGFAPISRGLPGGQRAAQRPAGRESARGPARSTPCATVRSCCRRMASA